MVKYSQVGHSGRAVWGVGLGRLVAGTVSSNPAQGMDVCPRLSVLCCPVYVEALRRADHSSKESYHMSNIVYETSYMWGGQGPKQDCRTTEKKYILKHFGLVKPLQ
jgi:hypothetical protein